MGGEFTFFFPSPEAWTQFSSVQSCPIRFDPMDCSTPGFLVHRQLLDLTQTHVHWVSDAIQPSHPLSSPCPPAFNLSQHQGLFQGVSSSHEVAKVLKFQLQHQSCKWIFRNDFLYDGLVWSPCSPRDTQESSPTPQFKSISFSALSMRHRTQPAVTPSHTDFQSVPVNLLHPWFLSFGSESSRPHEIEVFSFSENGT